MLLLGVALLWCSATWAIGIEPIKGVVECNGKGIAKVVVTDGESFALTDDKGRYELESSADNGLVYITIPAGQVCILDVIILAVRIPHRHS